MIFNSSTMHVMREICEHLCVKRDSEHPLFSYPRYIAALNKAEEGTKYVMKSYTYPNSRYFNDSETYIYKEIEIHCLLLDLSCASTPSGNKNYGHLFLVALR